jgi:hypothetical protein
MRRRRIGRPGVVGTMARTAVVAGTASATVGAVQNRQAKKAAEQGQAQQAALESQAQLAEMQAQITQMQTEQAAPSASPEDTSEEDALIGQLKQLADLKAAGVLDDAEFAAAKAKLLA